MKLDAAAALQSLSDLAERSAHDEPAEVAAELMDLLGEEFAISLGALDPSALLRPLTHLRAVQGCAVLVDRLERAIRAERKLAPTRLRVVEDGEGVSMVAALDAGGCPQLPDADYPVPQGWTIGPGGVQRLRHSPDGSTEVVQVARDMIAVLARSEDDETEQASVTLAWRYAGRWRIRTVARRTIATRDGVLSLADAGAPVEQQTASLLTGYLCACDAAISTPPGRSLRRLGWSSDGTSYLWGEIAIGEPMALIPPGDGEAMEARRYCSGGTWDGWVDQVWRPSVLHPAEVVILTSLAAPLLRVLRVQGWTLDIGMREGTGKTTSQQAAASVWGDRVMVPWPKTWAGMRETVEFRADIPAILDDTKHVLRARDGVRQVQDLLYQVAGDRSQVLGAQGGGTRAGRMIRTLAISSGEAPIADYLADAQGASRRILTIDDAPYPPGRLDLVQRVESGSATHYGHAGPSLVRWLLEHRDGWDELRRRYDHHVLRRAAQGETDSAGRLAQRIALLDVVAEVIDEALGLRASAEALDRFAAHVMAGIVERDQPLEALRHTVSWLSGRPSSVVGWGWDHRSPTPILAAAVGGQLQILPDTLDTCLRAGGWDPREIRRHWCDRGWSVTYSDGRTLRRTVRRSIGGRSCQVVELTPDAVLLGGG